MKLKAVFFFCSGVSLHLDTISALATRYGGKDRTLFFEDFVLCLAKTMSLFSKKAFTIYLFIMSVY